MSIQKSKTFSLLAGAGALCALLASNVAQAHISLERAGTHKSRYGDDEQKEGTCGREGGKRGTEIYTYEPGETVTVKLTEFIPHPGYFRFAFDNDGDDAFVSPKSIKPIDPSRKCPFNASDQCGESDFYNNESVLEDMDNLEPHMAGGQKTYTFQVKLPDVECDNCTLQVIQVMEDTVHGAYNVSKENPDGSLEDVYKLCIDLVLKRKGGSTAAGDAGTGSKSDAGAGAPKPSADAGVSARDAGASKPPVDDNDEANEDEDEDATEPEPTGSTRKPDAGTSKADAGKGGTSKPGQAGSVDGSDEDEDEDDAAPAPSEDGCSLAAGSSGSSSAALGVLLSLGMLATRRRRRAR
jgi:MYXO-CTERM domain-containing protein